MRRTDKQYICDQVHELIDCSKNPVEGFGVRKSRNQEGEKDSHDEGHQRGKNDLVDHRKGRHFWNGFLNNIQKCNR